MGEGERWALGESYIRNIFCIFVGGSVGLFFQQSGGLKNRMNNFAPHDCLYSIEISRLAPERYASLQTSSFIFVIIDVCCAVTRKKRVLTFNSELCIALLW